jgi:hypothetical protein
MLDISDVKCADLESLVVIHFCQVPRALNDSVSFYEAVPNFISKLSYYFHPALPILGCRKEKRLLRQANILF